MSDPGPRPCPGDAPGGDVIRGLPKAEIHLHLEGSVEPATLRAILASRGGDAGPADRVASLYAHRDFPHFLENFRDLCAGLRAPADFALITAALAERLRGEGVRYAEVFCSPSIFGRSRGLPADEILDAASAAARRAEAAGGPRLRFLLDGVRQWGVAPMEELVTTAHAARRYDVLGIGMGGDESALPTRAFAGVYAEARRLGLRTTVHAGEFDGPRSVWEALEHLGVERIGHGVRAAEDPVLLASLASSGIPLECCPTSNIRTGIAAGWRSHPIRALVEAGTAVTVSSDDPALFGTTLSGEWRALGERLDLAPAQVLAIGRRTIAATFQTEEEKLLLDAALRDAAATARFAA